jgi:DNA-directed RNA polymerase subunit E'/Rpb7
MGPKRFALPTSIYHRCLINRTIVLPINVVGKNLQTTIAKQLVSTYESVCIKEGFVKRGSIKLISYSSGEIKRGNQISFETVFECEVCYPVENMLINCIAKNITKAGIRAESSDETPSPVVVFVAKDHNYDVEAFSAIKEGQRFVAKVIGQRFELNDKYISIIAEIYQKGAVLEKEKEKEIEQVAIQEEDKKEEKEEIVQETKEEKEELEISDSDED